IKEDDNLDFDTGAAVYVAATEYPWKTITECTYLMWGLLQISKANFLPKHVLSWTYQLIKGKMASPFQMDSYYLITSWLLVQKSKSLLFLEYKRVLIIAIPLSLITSDIVQNTR
ncbi:hypothetical protein J0S82_007070, partial [Galemys pyrenaicus]